MNSMKVSLDLHISHTHSLISLCLKLSLFSVSEEESEEDNPDFITRDDVKRQSQLIVETNSKKKLWKEKKSKFWPAAT